MGGFAAAVLGLVGFLLPGCGASPDSRLASAPGPETRGTVIPQVIVSHPTPIFLKSFVALERRGAVSKVHLLFLVHKEERRLQRSLRRTARRLGVQPTWFVLEGLPPDASQPVSREERRRLGFRSTRVIPRVRYEVPQQWQHTFRRITKMSDGIIVPGGNNIPAAMYGEKQVAETASTTPLRSIYEIAFLRFLLEGRSAYLEQRPTYLVLGLCYGMQALNVALGGSLVQSIPTEIYGQRHADDIVRGDPDQMHRNYHLALQPATRKRVYRGWFHRIRVETDSAFLKRGDRDLYVLSNHVQAVKRPAEDLRIVGWSADRRVAELAVHRRFRNVLALQGHPERDFAWSRLGRYPPATREFHLRLWSEVSAVLARNAHERGQVR